MMFIWVILTIKKSQAFFEQAAQTSGVIPNQVTTDKEAALYPAMNSVFPADTKHRDSKYMNNRIEQNHRGIKSRYKVMKSFKNPFCALIFCTALEEIKLLFSRKNNTHSKYRNTIVSKNQEFNNLLKIAA